MGQFSRSLGRLIRGIIRTISFGLIKMAEPLEQRPEMIGMRYEDVIAQKAKAAQGLKNSIGSIIAEEEILRARAKTIAKSIKELAQEKDGAGVLAEERFKLLLSQGKTQEEALEDPELKEYQSAFNDASSTIVAKDENLKDILQRAEELKKTSNNFVIQAQELAREIEKLRSERHEAEAEARLAQASDAINEALAGISTSGADNELAEIRRDVAAIKGRAKASARIAETDIGVQRQKLREAAKGKVANVEFLKVIGAKVKLGTAPQPVATEKTSEEPPQTAKETPQLTE